MRLHRIYHGTNRRIAASTRNPPRSASIVARHMSACLHWQCMCLLTSLRTVVACAVKCSRDPGYCKVTYAAILARNRMVALIAARRSPIARICGRTCRRTRPTRTTHVNARTMRLTTMLIHSRNAGTRVSMHQYDNQQRSKVMTFLLKKKKENKK